MHPYFLLSSRLGFGCWSPDDIDLARSLWGDSRVMEFIGGPLQKRDVEERLGREIATMASDHVQYWPIFRLSDDVHIGCCGLRPYDPAARVFELGVHIRPEHWGRGFACESARIVMSHAFGMLGVRALFAGHHPQNHVSRHLMQKLGFRYTHDELYPPTGLRHPSYLITSEEHKIMSGSARLS